MRNLKKILALVLALMMALSVMVFASAANYDDYSDKDQVSAEYAEAVEVLTGMDIFWGSENNFYPKSNVTRAEVATLIYRIMTGDITGDQVDIYADYGMFADVRTSNWFAGYVNYAANADLVVGVGDDNYNPQGNVTGYELITILLRAIGYDANDEISGSTWKITAASLAKQAGILGQFNESTLGSALTREQVAYLLFNAIQARKVNYTVAFGYQPSRLGYSIAWDMFRLAKTTTTQRDSYGRPSDYWYSENDSTVTDQSVAAYTANVDTIYAVIEAVPLATYYTQVIDCDVTDDVNGGRSFTVPAANQFVNGRAGTNDRVVNDTDTISGFGQQGRTTEVYYVNGEWSLVFVDTYLAQVTAVVPAVVDTAGHVISGATMTLEITTGNAGATGTTVSGVPGNNYAVGSYVLFTQHSGLAGNGLTLTGLTSSVIDVVGAAPSVDVTVSGMHRTNGTLDGVVSNGTTYLANYTYTTNSSALFETLALSMITQNYRLYLDNQGNLMGMDPVAATSNVGVVTAFQAANVATGKWALQADLFLPDGTTTTLNFVDSNNQLFTSSSVSGLAVGDFIQFQPITVDGATYYDVVLNSEASGTDGNTDTFTLATDGDSSVITGVTDAFTTGTSDLDDNTQFIVANYAYDYSQSQTVLQGYSVYTGFKNIPTLTGTTKYQILDVGAQRYVLLTSDTTAAYVQTPKATVMTDDNSALFLSKGITYQFYSTYNVVIDGVKTTVNVSNDLEQYIQTGGYNRIYSLTGLNNQGYYTGLGNNNAVVGNIAANTNPTYADGVLTAGSTFLTVADDCQVYIVNAKTETVYAASLSNLGTYAAEVVNYEVNDYGYITHLYLTDADR